MFLMNMYAYVSKTITINGNPQIGRITDNIERHQSIFFAKFHYGIKMISNELGWSSNLSVHSRRLKRIRSRGRNKLKR